MVRTFLIVLVGYYFDIANDFTSAIKMMWVSITDFHFSELRTAEFFKALTIDKRNFMLIGLATVVLLIVSIIQERSSQTLRERICKKGYLVESAIFILLFFSVVVFGIYGPGTSPADFYYMQF